MDAFISGGRAAAPPFGPRAATARTNAAARPTTATPRTASVMAPAMGARPRASAPTDPLEAAYRFLAANGALAAAEVRDTPWPDALKPVAKDVEVGPRGGGFYYKTHPDGRKTKVYLKKKQRQDCKEGVLLGAGTTCPAAKITGYRERGTTRAEEAAATAIALMGMRQPQPQQR